MACRRASRYAVLAVLLLGGFGCAQTGGPSPLRRNGSLPVPVLNIAHRGARAFAPENTLEALEKAKALGAHMVELDVHLSKDGELIVVHDDDLGRCSDVREQFPDRPSYFVSDFTAAEIRTLDAGSWYVAELEKPAGERQPFLRSLTDREIESYVTPEDRVRYASGRVRPPTLEECLRRSRKLDLLVNVELKTVPRRYPGIAGKVVRLVERLGMERDVILSSFDHVQLVDVRAASGSIATAVLTCDRLYAPSRYVRDVLDADAFNPGSTNGYDTLGFNSVEGTLALEGVRNARSAGLGVNVWTENNPVRMRRLVEAGVTGIFTDYPNRLRDVLDALSR